MMPFLESISDMEERKKHLKTLVEDCAHKQQYKVIV